MLFFKEIKDGHWINCRILIFSKRFQVREAWDHDFYRFEINDLIILINTLHESKSNLLHIHSNENRKLVNMYLALLSFNGENSSFANFLFCIYKFVVRLDESQIGSSVTLSLIRSTALTSVAMFQYLFTYNSYQVQFAGGPASQRLFQLVVIFCKCG